MYNSRTSNIRLIRYIIIGLVSLIIIIYAFFRSLNYIHGPQIEIYEPVDGTAIASTTVTIIGKASQVNSLSLNGSTIFIDQAGNFKQSLVIFPGINIITFVAHDQFGRTKTKQLELVGTIQK